jgi:hypothetical protein
MSYSSRLFIVLAFCSIAPLMGKEFDKNLEEILKDIKEVAPSAIDWTFEQTAKYPQVPGIAVVSLVRAGKQVITKKPASFTLWAIVGSTFVAEGFRISADNYLQIKNAKAGKNAETLFQESVHTIKKKGEEMLAEAKEKIEEIKAPEDGTKK